MSTVWYQGVINSALGGEEMAGPEPAPAHGESFSLSPSILRVTGELWVRRRRERRVRQREAGRQASEEEVGKQRKIQEEGI